MPSPLPRSLTLRGLEVFETLARTGSVAETAARLGLSAPAVSQQIRNLSQSVGVELVHHSRRPMTLTPAGRLFLARAETALAALREGQRDLTALDLSGLSALSLGVIEDFENEVTPALAARLAEGMSQCAFQLHTAASHALSARLLAGDLDIAIFARNAAPPPGTTLAPLLRDPYILVVPKGIDVTAGLGALAPLAFLRRDPDQVMGQQIEAHLDQLGVSPPRRFEIDSNQSITALVAGGTGWTITTTLSLLRAARFTDAIDAHPLPGPPIWRDIGLYATDGWTADIPGQIAGLARELIDTTFVSPGQERMPWLADRFRLLN